MSVIAAKPSQVLMTADAVGGVWTYAVDLSRGLATAGVRTTLAVLGPAPSEAQQRAAEAVAGVELVETGLPLDWLADDPKAVLDAGKAVAALARRRGADVVHLNTPALAASGAFDRPLVGACHSCLATWWSAVRSGPLPDDFRWRTEVLARGYAACDRLIAPTQAFAAATMRAYAGVQVEAVWNGRAQAPLMAFAERPPAVITSGRLWDAGKNIAALDEAAGRLSVPVLAAGPLHGPNGEQVSLAAIRHLGALSPSVLSAELMQAPVFASLALYEPFGLGVLEAAQAGCALVLSDIPTFRELWDGAAVFVDPRAPAAAAEALETVLSDKARLSALGQAARARAARYTVKATTAGVLAAYAAALGDPVEAVA